jgi:hypothetical protein
VRHFADDCLEDEPDGVELPDDAAAREFALKVMPGLVQKEEDDWNGWTMEVTQGERRVWRLPFEAIEPSGPLQTSMLAKGLLALLVAGAFLATSAEARHRR